MNNHQASINQSWNHRLWSFLSNKIGTAISLIVLTSLISLSPVFTPKASANWLQLLRDIIVGLTINSLHDRFTQNPLTPPITYQEAIKNELRGGIVDFFGENLEISGRVIGVSEVERIRVIDSGVEAIIRWDDNVFSTILFVNESKVRVWTKGEEHIEYRGQWAFHNGTLYVVMDGGSLYQFR